MKKHIHLIVLVFFAFFTNGCIIEWDNSSFQINIIALTEADNGLTITLDTRDQIEIELPSNPSTGFRWEIVLIDDRNIIETGDSVFTQDENCAGLDGCGGIETFYFKGTRIGKGSIKLHYLRSFEEEPADQFEITIIFN